MKSLQFPFDLFEADRMPGSTGELIRATRHLSMFPPYPWGQWLYGRILKERWASVPGDLIELGVGRGGMSLFLGKLAQESGKRVWSFDSFVGLPEPHRHSDNPFFARGDYGPQSDFGNLFERFKREIENHNLRDVVLPVKGFFAQTLKQLQPDQRFCLAHLDSDLYDSILTSLGEVYERVVEGGLIIIDDYFHHAQGPLRAASDFFNSRNIYPLYHVSFPYSVFLFKGEEARPPLKRALDGNTYSFEWLKRDKHFMKILSLSIEKAARAGEDAESFQNRLAFSKLLRLEGHRSSDIYVYWRSLEAFWDSFADHRGEDLPPRLI